MSARRLVSLEPLVFGFTVGALREGRGYLSMLDEIVISWGWNSDADSVSVLG